MQETQRADQVPTRNPVYGSCAEAMVREALAPDLYVFNPFAEGYIARGKAFAPVQHQVDLAKDLANLPQFLCAPGDVVLVPAQPSLQFLHSLEHAGFHSPRFLEPPNGRVTSEFHLPHVGRLRPWAWGPDSIELLEPFFCRATVDARDPSQFFNQEIARLYSKAWSAGFLRQALARFGAHRSGDWLCSEDQAGVAVNTPEDALDVIKAIRSRGHHRVIIKETYGLAGHNSIRLWEPELLPPQRKWLADALSGGCQVVVEPWLEREIDFSLQLEMGRQNLSVFGYTGLINDRRGQYIANWANADYKKALPAQIASLFPAHCGIEEDLQHLYMGILELLETELRSIHFTGPISIDAFVYRRPQGDCRLKPIVEINPRYTMGRLTAELMRHACPGTSGLFRLVNSAKARAAGFEGLSDYAASLHVKLTDPPNPCIREGILCLNDPGRAKVCLATFQVGPTVELLSGAHKLQPGSP